MKIKVFEHTGRSVLPIEREVQEWLDANPNIDIIQVVQSLAADVGVGIVISIFYKWSAQSSASPCLQVIQQARTGPLFSPIVGVFLYKK